MLYFDTLLFLVYCRYTTPQLPGGFLQATHAQTVKDILKEMLFRPTFPIFPFQKCTIISHPDHCLPEFSFCISLDSNAFYKIFSITERSSKFQQGKNFSLLLES